MVKELITTADADLLAQAIGVDPADFQFDVLNAAPGDKVGLPGIQGVVTAPAKRSIMARRVKGGPPHHLNFLADEQA